jgi:hypothetical protein
VNWIRDFLVGLFTRHLGTKFMALLLAGVLFIFAQQSHMQTGLIDELTLEFELARELEETYVLLTPGITLVELDIRGLRSKVGPLLAQFKRERSIRLTITEDFLALHEDPLRIRIDEDFFHLHELLDRDLDIVSEMPAEWALRLANMYVAVLTPALAEASKERVRLPEDSDYEGTLASGQEVELRFLPPSLKLRGPEDAFAPEAQHLYFTVADVDTWLRNNYIDGSGPPRMEVESTAWVVSGVRPPFLQHVQALVGVDWIPADELASRVRTEFEIRPRKVQVELQPDIHLKGNRDDLGALDGYVVEGPEGPLFFGQEDIEQGRCTRFAVEVPASLAGSEDLKLLVVVLDVAHRGKDGDNLKVPIYLDVRDRDRRDLLAEVRIKVAQEYLQREPVIVFVPKAPG